MVAEPVTEYTKSSNRERNSLKAVLKQSHVYSLVYIHRVTAVHGPPLPT